jgi:folate-dependent phosphoribosylglycinamide formyltransferase PurN
MPYFIPLDSVDQFAQNIRHFPRPLDMRSQRQTQAEAVREPIEQHGFDVVLAGFAKVFKNTFMSGYVDMVRLMSTLPGAHPLGALCTAKFAPGEFV